MKRQQAYMCRTLVHERSSYLSVSLTVLFMLLDLYQGEL